MAKEFSIYGEIKVDTNNLKKDVKEIERELKSTTKEIEKTEKEASKLSKTNNKTARSFEKLKQDASKAKERLRQANTQYKKGDINAKQYATAVRRSANATAALNTRLRDTSARLKDSNRGFTSFSTKVGLAAAAGGIFAIAGARIAGALGDGVRHMYRYNLELDSIRNRMTAVTGSTKNMQKAWGELNKIANTSVGVTRAFARETFTTFKGLDVGDAAINKLIPALGRLNAAFEIPDMKGFAQNLNQIFQQGFERADIKEAIGRVPIFEELLKSAFGTSDGDKLRKLKDSGKLTMETFLTGLSGAVQNNSKLSKINESVATQLAKTSERLSEAFSPLAKTLFDPILIAASELGTKIATEIEANQYKDIGDTISFNITKFTLDGLVGFGKTVNEAMGKQMKANQAEFVRTAKTDGIATAYVNDFFKNLSTAMDYATPGWKGVIRAFFVTGFGKDLETPTVAGIQRTMSSISETMVSALKSLAQQAGVSSRTIALMIVSPLLGLPSMLYDIGKNVVQGLVNGLRARYGDLKNAAQQIVSTVTQIATGGFGIKSPSKVFHYYGEMIVQGLANGIEQSIPNAKRVMDSLLQTIIDSGKKISKVKIGDKLQELQGLLRQLNITAEASPMDKLLKLLSDPAIIKKLGDQASVFQSLALRTKAMADEAKEAAKQYDLLGRVIAAIPAPLRRDAEGGAGAGGGLPIPNTSGGENGDRRIGGDIIPPPPPQTISLWEELLAKFDRFKDSLPTLRQTLTDTFEGALFSIGDVFANAVQEWDGTVGGFFKSIASGFADMARQIISQLIRILAYKVVFGIISAATGGGFMEGFSNPSGVFGDGGGAGGGSALGGLSIGGGSSLAFGGAAGMMSGGGDVTNNSFSPSVNVNISGMKDANDIRQAGHAVGQVALQRMQMIQNKNK